MSAVFTVSALFGCGGSGKYTVDDIISFHTSYYGMASNPVYAFVLRKQDENWLFSASCRVKSREDYYTSFSSFPIPTEEAEKFLEIIREEDEIRRLRKYRNPIRFFHIADEPMRSSGMTFTDGNSIEKETKLCDRAIDCLRDLADRYYEAAEKAESESIKNELTSVSVRLKDTEQWRSHSFTLKKDGDHWYFSFECSFGEDSLPVKVENVRLSDEETDDVIRIIAKYDLISKASGYAEPPEDIDSITDRNVYITEFSLADGSGINSSLPAPDELTGCLYELAGAKLLTEVNISRGCMDHSSSYSFSLERTEDNWFLSFDCAVDSVGYHTNAEKIPVNTEEAEEILQTVRERRLVSEVLSYEAPSESDVYVLDETTYNTSFAFSDGSSVHAPISAGRELTNAFYSLAGRKIKK